MLTLTKLAPRGAGAGRSPFADLLDHVRRLFAETALRRARRPLQDLDRWSDQSEVAYYEDCRLCRSA